MIRFLEFLSSWGGVKRDVVFLILSGLALAVSLIDPTLFPIHPAWAAILLCGVPILLEAVIGLVTAFDIKADVLVSIALIASVVIGEDFAAGEVAFIMQDGRNCRMNAAIYKPAQLREIFGAIREATGIEPTGSLAELLQV